MVTCNGLGYKSWQGLFSSSFGLHRQVQLKCKRVSRDKDKGQGAKEEREKLQYVSDFRQVYPSPSPPYRDQRNSLHSVIEALFFFLSSCNVGCQTRILVKLAETENTRI